MRRGRVETRLARTGAVTRLRFDCQSAPNFGFFIRRIGLNRFIRRIGLNRFRAFSPSSGQIFFAGPCFFSGSALRPAHDGIRRTKRCNLTHVLIAKAVGTRAQSALTSSVIPQRTSFHRRAELYRFRSQQRSSCGLACVFLCPSELRAVTPHTMHDHCQATRQGNNGFLPTSPPFDVHRPGL